jgi:hypothetical protein
MAIANNNTQVAELDFATIKENLTNFLKSQDAFKDYNFSGSGLSVLLDILAYNTQYNSYYLNMVSNEMFMDTALKRSSVVSHAKELGYIPKTAIAPSATVNISVLGAEGPLLTIPKYTPFLSELVNGKHYNFVTTDSYTTEVTTGGDALFQNVLIKQGIPVKQTFTLDVTTNPSAIFKLTNPTIDSTTIEVIVYENPTVNFYETYVLSDDYINLTPDSRVYFLQESTDGNYEIYFGDGILGKKLTDGSRIIVNYLNTSGTESIGANNFSVTADVGSSSSVDPIKSAADGGDKETIDSIRYQATKAFSSQRRAVTKEDYITAVQQNRLGFSFDAVSAWGGQENDPPVYGQVFLSIKPKGAYSLSEIQKKRLIEEVIKPISMMSIVPNIIDPDYTYIKINANVYYDPKKTTLTDKQIGYEVSNSISTFARTTLNTFNSTFLLADLIETIKNVDTSILTNEVSIQVQKKFYPNLVTGSTYKLYYGTPLKKGLFLSGVSSSPGISYKDPNNITQTLNEVYVEEVPSSTGGLEGVTVINTGYGYQYEPIIEIIGDGAGATAQATIVAGKITKITVVNKGSGYTSAIVKITPAANDTTGALGAATAQLEGRVGTLRLYWYDAKGVKTIIKDNVGTINYNEGLVTLGPFSPVGVNNEQGQLTITANPLTSIISSSYNRIITVDPFDPTAITVNVIAKT